MTGVCVCACVYILQFAIWGGNRPGRSNGDEGHGEIRDGNRQLPAGRGKSREILPSGGLAAEFTVTAERGEERNQIK